MSAERTAARRAWALSLTLHGVTLALWAAWAGRPCEAPGPIGAVPQQVNSLSIGVVQLAAPAQAAPAARSSAPPPAAAPAELPLAFLREPPCAPPPNPIASLLSPPDLRPARPNAVQSVEHREPAATPQVAPVAHASPVAHTSGSVSVSVPPPGAATAFFGVPAVGRSVVFVLDRSASMGLDGRLDRARREVVASLRLLPPSAKFQVIAYDRSALPLQIAGRIGLLPATPDAVAAAAARLDGLAAEGGTDHLRALQEALILQPDVIYFLTDEDELTPAQVRDVTQRNRGRVCIHALCLVPPPPGRETPMQALARGNRGVFRVVR